MKTIIFYLLLPSGQGNIVTDRPLVGQIVMHWEVGTFWKLCKPPLHCYAIFLIKRIQLHNIFCSSNRTILAAKVSKDVFKILFLLLLRTLKLPKNQSLHWCELKCLLCSFFFFWLLCMVENVTYLWLGLIQINIYINHAALKEAESRKTFCAH